MGGGGKKEPTVTQAPTKTPGQQQFLESLLSFFSQATAGQTIGGAYGGPGQANYSPIKIGEGKGETTPTGGGQRPRRERQGGRGSPLDEILAGPIVNPYREGMTGNFSKRRG